MEELFVALTERIREFNIQLANQELEPLNNEEISTVCIWIIRDAQILSLLNEEVLVLDGPFWGIDFYDTGVE